MTLRIRSIVALAVFLPQAALARTLHVGVGTQFSVEVVLTRIINYMAGAVVFAAAAMFAVGALYVTASRGDADTVKKGKNLIIGAIIGAAIVLGSFAILRTIFYYIYAFGA
jgi:hypothetical protein